MEKNNKQRNIERMQEAQIIRKDGKGVIFEVMDNSFPIGKVVMNFQKYDENAPAGSKVQSRISIYMDFASFLKMANDFAITGNGPRRMFGEQKAAQQAGQRYYGMQVSMGGTSAAGLQKQNRQRADGKAEFRSLSIAPSTKANSYALFASSGAGKVSSTGGFVMDGAPDTRIIFPITTSDWAEVLLLTKASIEAYLSYKYAKRFEVLDREREEYFAGLNNNRAYNNQSQNNYRNNQAPQNKQVAQQAYNQAPDAFVDENLDAFGGGSIGASSSDFPDMNYDDGPVRY